VQQRNCVEYVIVLRDQIVVSARGASINLANGIAKGVARPCVKSGICQDCGVFEAAGRAYASFDKRFQARSVNIDPVRKSR
jgi:hypothetical protein